MTSRIDAITDSSFLFSLFNIQDKQHYSYVQVISFYPNIVIPDVVLTETAFLFRRYGGTVANGAFLKVLTTQKPLLMRVTYAVLERAHHIMNFYIQGAIPLDFVDCVIVATAERYAIKRVFTLDRRDFGIIRTNRGDHLEILP